MTGSARVPGGLLGFTTQPGPIPGWVTRTHRHALFAVKNSPTKATMIWFNVCKKLKVKPLWRLCDVRMRWGLTKHILVCVLLYKAVVNEVCKDKILLQYVIEDMEWDA